MECKNDGIYQGKEESVQEGKMLHFTDVTSWFRN